MLLVCPLAAWSLSIWPCGILIVFADWYSVALPPGGSLLSYPFHKLPEGLGTLERLMKLMVLSDRRRDQAWQAANPDRVQKLISYTLARAVPEHSTDDYKMGARRQLEARAGHNVINRLQEINLKTLICAGQYD